MPPADPVVVPIAGLDWPDALEDVEVQRAGSAYLAFEARLLGRRDFLAGSRFYRPANGDGAAPSLEGGERDGGGKKEKEYDLFVLSERKLEKLSHYQILHRSLPMHASPDDIRRAYHRACLKYHPDKTGRGEEDEVFLRVKAAFDTLSDPDKRRSYDSTQNFDERIPPEGVAEEDFYKEYGPVFKRNLRFASCNDPAKMNGDKGDKGNNPAPKKKGKNKNKKNKNNDARAGPPPPFGDDATPVDEVHAFYDFWIHFDSWRDFTAKAAEEAEHDVDMADCREEKRWMQVRDSPTLGSQRWRRNASALPATYSSLAPD